MHQSRRFMDVRRQQVVYWPSVVSQAMLPASKSIFVLGYTNTGTNWLCQLISNYLSIPLFEPWKEIIPSFLKAHVFHGHRFISLLEANPRCLYLSRDGRDVVISKYYKIASNPTQIARRKEFAEWSGFDIAPDHIREQLPVFIDWFFTKDRSAAINWSSHIQQGFQKQCTHVAYESLLIDALTTLEKIFCDIDSTVTIDRERLESVIDSRQIGKVRTKENSVHKRKGVTGEWKIYYTEKACEKFANYGQNALELAGYEKNDDWVTSSEKG